MLMPSTLGSEEDAFLLFKRVAAILCMCPKSLERFCFPDSQKLPEKFVLSSQQFHRKGRLIIVANDGR